jgi:hypothetical protein
MNQATKKITDRGAMTITRLLEKDSWASVPSDQQPPDVRDVPNLTIPVRDWLKKYLAGEPTPYADLINPDDYRSIELVVSVLIQSGGLAGEMLPESAIDFIEEWLYKVEEETDLHIWNVADIARPFLAHMFDSARISDSTDGTFELVEAAISRLSTEKELADFYKRHGLKPKKKRKRTGKSEGGPRSRPPAALKAARVLADPSTSEETRGKLQDAINELPMAAGVPVWHPALAERAVTIMLESYTPMLDKEDLKRDCQRLHDLLAEIPDW